MSSQLRNLGRNGPLVPRLGFGLMGLSAFYGDSFFYGKPTSDIALDPRFKLLDRAVEIGATFWDTSDAYGDNEDMIGAWFRHAGKRDQIFLATKFGNVRDSNGDVTGEIRGDKAYVKQSCEKSLKRLGVDTIDLYYYHRIDKRVPIEVTISAMVELLEEGKIRYIGISEASANTPERAAKVHHITAHQVEYSPFVLDIESPTTNILQKSRELGIATVAYSPIGRGFLTGTIRSRADLGKADVRATWMPQFSEENFDKNLEIVDEVKKIADKKGCTSGQLALAWLMAQGDDVFPIPGTKQIPRLEENCGSLQVQLTSEEVAAVREKVDNAVHGARAIGALLDNMVVDTPPLK